VRACASPPPPWHSPWSARARWRARYRPPSSRANEHGPGIEGTGTEDFYEGGWYFYLTPFTLPLNGLSAVERDTAGCPRPSCMSAYRLMLGDAIPFSGTFEFGIEHGGTDEVAATYGSTAYWYGSL
jgi:hypothetical protein